MIVRCPRAFVPQTSADGTLSAYQNGGVTARALRSIRGTFSSRKAERTGQPCAPSSHHLFVCIYLCKGGGDPWELQPRQKLQRSERVAHRYSGVSHSVF